MGEVYLVIISGLAAVDIRDWFYVITSLIFVVGLIAQGVFYVFRWSLSKLSDRRLLNRLRSLAASWPSGTWNLPAAESYMLVLGLNRQSTDPFKLALLQNIANGTFVLKGDLVAAGPALTRLDSNGTMELVEELPVAVRLPDSLVALEPSPEAQRRRIGYRDVELMDVFDGNRVVRLLQRGDSVEVLHREAATGRAMVRSVAGDTGWIKEIELRQQDMSSLGVRQEPDRSPIRKSLAVAAEPARPPFAETEYLQGSLRILYSLWHAAPRSQSTASDENVPLLDVAKEVARTYQSVSRFGAQAVMPLLAARGLCTLNSDGVKYSITPSGAAAKAELEQRIAMHLRATVDREGAERKSARIILLQALLAVSAGYSSVRLDDNAAALYFRDDVTGRQPNAAGPDIDSYALWSLHWHHLDANVDSASDAAGGDGSWGDGGDGGGDGGGGGD